jgi:4-diphosphocytidyl-2-C-methyl-D-erythritol kinase
VSDDAVNATEIVRTRAHAKVNLALRVGAPGADGYHPVATIFQTISLADRLIAWPLGAAEAEEDLHPDAPVRLRVEGAVLPENNTVTRAAAFLADLLRQRGAASLRPLALHLTKRIPLGAGLGGGSSDAVAALLSCARLWCPNRPWLSFEDLVGIARQIGADVPYFLTGGTALGTGRGDRIAPLDEIPQQWLVIAAPCCVAVATPEGYAAFDEARGWSGGAREDPPVATTGGRDTPRSAAAVEIAGYTGELDPDWMGNDLHLPVVGLHPEVEAARRALRAAGAGIAQMSGSGSASFGTFGGRHSAQRAARAMRAEGLRAWPCVTVSARQQAAALQMEQ